MAAQMLVVRLVAAFALGTLLMIVGILMVPDVVAALPRLVTLALFYGGAYLLLTWVTPSHSAATD